MSMTPRRSNLAPPTARIAAALVLALVAVGCGGGSGSPVPSATPSSATSQPPPSSPPPTEVPGGASPSPSPAATVAPTTATDWGPIWDAVPAAFPRYPGSTLGEPMEGPASAVLMAPAASRTVTTWYQGALEAATYSTLSLSGPFEDGSEVIESVGPTPDCLVRTTVRPADGSAIVTILYGAGCPPPAG